MIARHDQTRTKRIVSPCISSQEQTNERRFHLAVAINQSFSHLLPGKALTIQRGELQPLHARIQFFICEHS